jgi:hypothetical protein
MVSDPLSGKPVELVQLRLGVMFRGVVHVDPVDQVFLDPVTTEVGVLFVGARNGLIEIESLSIRPDESALRGIEVHVLH